MFAAVGGSELRQVAIKQVKVEVHRVTVGMFISRLDRPWTQTPFPIQGFYIRDAEEIKQLKTHCNFVFIDVIKGIAPQISKLKTSSSAKSNADVSRRMTKNKPVSVSLAPLKFRHNIYLPAVTSLKIELVKAKQLHLKVFNAVTEVMLSLENSGGVSVQGTKRVASEMVDSILRNPDAFSWLSQVREHDVHTYSHAVRSTVLAILFGRQIGLSKRDLNVLAMGVLLKDVGKIKIDSALLGSIVSSAFSLAALACSRWKCV